MIRAVDTTETEYGPKVVLSSKKSDARTIKSLPWNATHRSWNPDEGYWTIDYKPEIVGYLEEIDCQNLDWLRDEFSEQLEEARHFTDLSQAKTSDYDVRSPEGLDYYPFQRAGIEYAVEKFEQGNDGVLIADQMGLGKTIQAIGVLNDQGFDRAVVVCPASLKQNWKRELEKWLVDEVSVRVYKEGPLRADVEIINYALFSRRERLPNRVNTFDAEYMILDESHYIKNKDAARTERIRKIDVDCKIFLTGTPIKNRPIELWTQVQELTDEFDFWNYAKTYCGAKKTRWGWDMDGATNMDELQERLRSTVMVRRQKQEVLDDLPEKMRQVIPLAQNGMGELVSREQDLYDSHEDEISAAKKRVAQAKVNDNQEKYERAIEELREAREVAFEQMAEVRHEIAVQKADHVVEHVRNVLESEDKVVVFAHHKDVVSKLKSAFGREAATLTGGTPTQERQEAVDRFQNDPEVRVFVGSIHAAGTGLTLTAASHIVFAELDWTPSVNRQAEDRCHRIGQDETVHVQYLVVDGSLESRIAQMNVEKQRAIDAAMDNEFDSDFYSADEVDVDLVPTGADETLDESVAEEHTEEIDETTPEDKALILQGVQKLSAMCDGAQSLDGMGFNKADASFGHSLAANGSLSDRQAHYAKKLINKYSRQLDDDLVDEVV